MALDIRTFSNTTGGVAFFKAVGHPLAAAKAHELVGELAAAGPIAVYDPLGAAAEFAALYELSSWDISDVFVQRVEDLGTTVLGRNTQPVTQLKDTAAGTVFIAAFDCERLLDQVGHLAPPRARVVALDRLRLPDDMLTNRRRYLDPLNFATNFAFFRDADGHHTRLVTTNYWQGYGARGVELWMRLFDADGTALAEWREGLPDSGVGVAIDSAEVRRRFGLGPFTGSLFIHALKVAGHDIVKYALDTYGDDARVLSCTHDANAWPSDLYAGLPAPRSGERVLLWVQNSHPAPIPAGAIGLNRMGSDAAAWFDEEIPPFGTRALDVERLLPGLRWPAQVEVRAGRHFVRPRYEVVANDGACRIAHANVERTDLADDPDIPKLAGLMGKGFILPAPVLPPAEWRSIALPTPMATCQHELPLEMIVYDASGQEALRHRVGRLPRDHATALEVDALLDAAGATLASGYGHFELAYDFSDGGGGDGWLHALFRYEHRTSGHGADTSFGAHIFNLPITYKSEPQSYAGRPPGLSTRLYLRLGADGRDTLCHLIFPASGAWHAASSTELALYDRDGDEVAQRAVRVPLSGSLAWRYSETFDAAERARAGDGAYVIVRDVTCRLFGYHGLLGPDGVFSFDHMFGF